MKLSYLGWSDFFISDELDLTHIARITAVHRSHLVAMTVDKEINLYASGHVDERLAVGDWVTTTPEFVDEQDKPAAIIKSVLERKSKISRSSNVGEKIIAANVDRVFIVTSANQDFNMNRLHRFLVLIREGGCTPVVVLSKIDLAKNPSDLVKQLKDHLSVEVIATSTVQNTGISDLLGLMPVGSTSVFVGSSGVGKSTLVNRLLNTEVQATKEIREDDGKGKHTTTARQLFFIEGHGMIIDTPGVREVQVFGSSESLAETFPKIETLINQCQFSDCQHVTEPGCAVIAGLDSGELSEAEWGSYQKLLREMAFANRKSDKVAASNAKKRWKGIHVAMRKRRKLEE